MSPHQGVDFLSCDSTFIDIPTDNGKTTKGAHMPTIADHFQTDKMPKFQRKPPRALFPFSLCGCRLHVVSLVGCVLFCLMIAVVVGFVIVWISNHYDNLESPARAIVILCIALIAILAAGGAFIIGSLKTRSHYMIPFLFVTFFGVVAQIGSTVVLFLTLYEDASEKYSKDESENIVICILLRIIPLVLVLIQSYFFVCYVKSFLHCRRNQSD